MAARIYLPLLSLDIMQKQLLILIQALPGCRHVIGIVTLALPWKCGGQTRRRNIVVIKLPISDDQHHQQISVTEHDSITSLHFMRLCNNLTLFMHKQVICTFGTLKIAQTYSSLLYIFIYQWVASCCDYRIFISTFPWHVFIQSVVVDLIVGLELNMYNNFCPKSSTQQEISKYSNIALFALYKHITTF